MATTEELKNQFRLEADDIEAPGSGDDSDSLWSDAEIFGYLDKAQKEFTRLVDYLADSTTPAVADAEVIAADAWIDIDPGVTKIRRARLEIGKTKVFPITLREYEAGIKADDYGVSANSSGWEDLTGVPKYIITDMEFDKGRLVPIPIANDVILMSVFRMSGDIVDKDSLMEVGDSLHQEAIMNWVKKLAYSKHDVETYDEALADKFGADFRAYTAELKATVMRQRRRSGSSLAYGGL